MKEFCDKYQILDKYPAHTALIKKEGPCDCVTSADMERHHWEHTRHIAAKRKHVEETKTKYREEKIGGKNVHRNRKPRTSAIINKARTIRNERRRQER